MRGNGYNCLTSESDDAYQTNSRHTSNEMMQLSASGYLASESHGFAEGGSTWILHIGVMALRTVSCMYVGSGLLQASAGFHIATAGRAPLHKLGLLF